MVMKEQELAQNSNELGANSIPESFESEVENEDESVNELVALTSGLTVSSREDDKTVLNTCSYNFPFSSFEKTHEDIAKISREITKEMVNAVCSTEEIKALRKSFKVVNGVSTVDSGTNTIECGVGNSGNVSQNNTIPLQNEIDTNYAEGNLHPVSLQLKQLCHTSNTAEADLCSCEDCKWKKRHETLNIIF